MPERQRGFGLLELLLAIAILGIGIIAVAGLVSTTGEHARAAERRTDRTIVAQQALERAARVPFDSLVSATDTVRSHLGPYAIDLTVGGLGPSLKRLDLTATDSATARPLRLTVIVSRPAWLP